MSGLTSKKDINSEGLINDLEGFVQLFLETSNLGNAEIQKWKLRLFFIIFVSTSIIFLLQTKNSPILSEKTF